MRTRIVPCAATGRNRCAPLWQRPCYCHLHGRCSTCRAWRAIARRVLPPLRLVRGAA